MLNTICFLFCDLSEAPSTLFFVPLMDGPERNEMERSEMACFFGVLILTVRKIGLMKNYIIYQRC
jgi:hypothetical protein